LNRLGPASGRWTGQWDFRCLYLVGQVSFGGVVGCIMRVAREGLQSSLGAVGCPLSRFLDNFRELPPRLVGVGGPIGLAVAACVAV